MLRMRVRFTHLTGFVSLYRPAARRLGMVALTKG